MMSNDESPYLKSRAQRLAAADIIAQQQRVRLIVYYFVLIVLVGVWLL